MSYIRKEYLKMLREGSNSEKHSVGAPKGGRVHWLLWNLTPEFKGRYILHYDYRYHNYVFLRYEKRKLYDIFIVMRTSIHRWKCIYFNVKYMAFERCSTRKSEHMANCLMLISETYDKNLSTK